MNFDAVIFDLDGVITQTALVHGSAWKRMFDEYLRSREERFGEPFREFTHAGDYLPYVDGKPRYQGVDSFLKSRGIEIPFGDPTDPPDKETVCGLGNRKNILFNAVLDEEGVEVYPTSVALIKELKSRGIHLAVASSSKNCKPVLERAGLLDYFEARVDGIVSAEIGLHGKPEPDIFTESAQRLGVSCHRSIVVEDAVSGVQAGKKGNFGLVIGIARENNIEELKAAGADIVVEDLGEITIEDMDNWFTRGMKEDGFLLRYFDYDTQKEKSREALLTIGNGVWGTRGAMEESRANKVNYPATYFAGLYNRLISKVAGRDIENEDFVNAINWLPVTFRIGDGPWFVFEPQPNQEIISIERSLDFRTGELVRTLALRDSKGRETRIISKRLASMAQPGLAAQSYSLTPLNYSGTVHFRAGLSANHINAGVERYSSLNQKHLKPVRCETGENRILLVSHTTQSNVEIQAEAFFRVFGATSFDKDIAEDSSEGFLQWKKTVEQGETWKVEKCVAMGISLHPDAASEGTADARSENYETIREKSIAAWKSLWKRTDINIEGDRNAQKLVRLHVYHMLITASPHTALLDTGIPPRGLHGEAYRGHIFWDEIYFFPWYLIHTPEVAKSMLLYRYRRLEAARENARTHGYDGAMFPWQSGSDGREETQVVHLNPVSGEWGPDFSSLQRHVNVAIGFNIWNYCTITGDHSFTAEYGVELILDICKFWISAFRYDEKDQRYHIDRVMGPDEFHEALPGDTEGGLTDNAYTNIMVHWLIGKATHLLLSLPEQDQTRILEKTGIDHATLKEWNSKADKLAVSISPEGIIEQFAGYFNLSKLDINAYREKYGDIHRMDRILKAEGKSPDAYQISKQADVMMIFYLIDEQEVTEILQRMGYSVPEDYVNKNYRYYLERTSHGSTLSRLVYSTLAFRLGLMDEGMPLFRETLASDLEDIQGGTTGEGIHCGVMGGTLMTVLTVFGGLDMKQAEPGICPRLPNHWEELQYRFGIHDQDFSVKLIPGLIQIFCEKSRQKKIKVHICNRIVNLTKGELGTFKF